MGYTLAQEAMRVVEKNDRGVVTYRKRYKKGDEVDVSKIDDAHVEKLLANGALVKGDLDEDAPNNPTATTAGVLGDLGSTQTTDNDPGDVPDPSGDSGDTGDEYDDMSYGDLQQAAKDRNLNAGGSAEDLRARLREDDADDDES